MKNWFLVFAMAVLLALLAACIAAVVWLAPWTRGSLNQAASAAHPTLIAQPPSGGANTPVTLTGSGFPANTRVTLHLGPPNAGATQKAYGETMTDADGNFRIAFTMPAAWPDGTAIAEPRLVIVALVGQGETKATAEFSYSNQTVPQPQP